MSDKIKLDGVEVSIAALKAAGFVRQEQSSKKRWRADYDAEYFYFRDDGAVDYHREANDVIDNHLYAMGNYFRTNEEAEAYRDRQLATMRVLDALREYEGDWVADWDGYNQNKYSAFWDGYSDSFDLNANTRLMLCPCEWYSTKEAWERVIAERPDDVKLMMGVK